MGYAFQQRPPPYHRPFYSQPAKNEQASSSAGAGNGYISKKMEQAVKWQKNITQHKKVS